LHSSAIENAAERRHFGAKTISADEQEDTRALSVYLAPAEENGSALLLSTLADRENSIKVAEKHLSLIKFPSAHPTLDLNLKLEPNLEGSFGP